jgi:hypothetical protein
VINADVIKKAEDFDREWRKSSTVFSTWIKAQLAELLPLLDDLISRAGDFAASVKSSLDAAANSPAGQEFTARSNRAATILEMLSSENDAKENADIVAAAAKAMAGTLSEATTKLLDQQIAVKSLAQFWNDYAASMFNAASASDKYLKSLAANDNGPRPIIPAKDTTDSKDALDRSIESLKRHTEVTLADADAQGLGAQALQEYRAIADLVAAAERAGIDVTGKLGEKFADLATKAGEAAARSRRPRSIRISISRRRRACSRMTTWRSPQQLARHLWQRCSGRDGVDRGVADAPQRRDPRRARQCDKFCRHAGEGPVRRQGGLRLGREGPRGSLKIPRQHGDQAASLRRFREGGGLGDLGGGHLGCLAGQSYQRSQGHDRHARSAQPTAPALRPGDQRHQHAAGPARRLRRECGASANRRSPQGRRADECAAAGAAAERLKIETDFQKQAAELEKQAADARLARQQSLEDRIFAATNDTSTLQGALAAQQRDFAKERLDEAKNGNLDLAQLDRRTAGRRARAAQVVQRQGDRETKRAEQERLDAINGTAKSVVDYLNGLVSGPSSTLSPTATLANAQSVYNANLGLAQVGNIDAQNKFVSLADNLEKAARAVYASGQGYQDIRSQIISQGLALPAVQTSRDRAAQRADRDQQRRRPIRS